MFALTDAEAVVLAAVVPVVIGTGYNVWAAVTTKKSVRQTSAEVRPNGGASLRDAIDRVETTLKRLHERHDKLAERLYLIEDYVTRPKDGR